VRSASDRTLRTPAEGHAPLSQLLLSQQSFCSPTAPLCDTTAVQTRGARCFSTRASLPSLPPPRSAPLRRSAFQKSSSRCLFKRLRNARTCENGNFQNGSAETQPLLTTLTWDFIFGFVQSQFFS